MAKSFLKKVQEDGEKATTRPVFDAKNKVYFVNPEKYDRAKEILALILGEKVPQKIEETERKEHYTKQLAKHEIDPKSDDALPAIYEIIGGLIRSEVEQKEAETKAKELKSKAKKRMIE